MSDEQIKILDKAQIKQRIKRLAIEILEQNYAAKEIVLAGINNNGFGFAKLITAELKKITKIQLSLTRLSLNPAEPTKHEITLEMPVEEMKNKVIIIVDDVANTGRTLFYAVKPLLEIVPKKVQIAVLVDRTHKSFPITADYIGMSLATTLKENIDVQIDKNEDWAVFLN